MTHTVQPPNICGLKWQPIGKLWIAKQTPAYKALSSYEGVELERLGFGVGKAWWRDVTFDPEIADTSELNVALQALLTKRADKIERGEGPAKRRLEKEQKLRDAAARAPQVYDVYGPTIVKRADWEWYCRRQAAGDDIELGKLVLATEAKIAIFDAEARARAHQPAPVATADLPDAVVERAIRALTALDSDRAEKANDAGWSRSTTLGGHWCCQMLGTDRGLAIAEGRRLIAGHLVQLAKLGIVPWFAVPKKGRAA